MNKVRWRLCFEQYFSASIARIVFFEVRHPDLVKSFLHKLSVFLNANDEHIMKTIVRDCVVEENLSDVAAMLNIPSSGYFLKKGVNHVEGPWSNYDKMEFYYQICRFPKEMIIANQRTARLLCYAKNLTVSDRMLHYIICYVLIPKDSNHAQINDLEMQLLFAIKNKIRVNWILTIMYHLQQQLSLSTRLPYARLISRILELTTLDLNREPTIKMKSTTNEINEITIVKNTGIFKDNDGTYKYSEEGANANQAFPVPAGGITNEFLYQTIMTQHRETSRAIASLRNLVLSSHHTNPDSPVVSDEENEEEEEEEDMADEDV